MSRFKRACEDDREYEDEIKCRNEKPNLKSYFVATVVKHIRLLPGG